MVKGSSPARSRWARSASSQPGLQRKRAAEDRRADRRIRPLRRFRRAGLNPRRQKWRRPISAGRSKAARSRSSTPIRRTSRMAAGIAGAGSTRGAWPRSSTCRSRRSPPPCSNWRKKNRSVLITASATSDFTAKWCSPSPPTGPTTAMRWRPARRNDPPGPKSWYFLTVDIAFGAALQRDATEVIEATGGKVTGCAAKSRSTRRFLVAAAAGANSGAQEIGLASVGGDPRQRDQTGA